MVDFRSALASENRFTDETYLTGQAAESPILTETWTDSDKDDDLSWIRLNDVFPISDGCSLWGDLDKHPGESGQHARGNCWLMEAATSISEEPERLKQMFINKEMNV